MKIFNFLNNVSRLSSNVKSSQNIYKNPCLDLQQYLDVPLFNKNEVYTPSQNALYTANNIYVPEAEHKILCISKTIDFDEMPISNLPEVAFIGRSNAGKSSLLKAIFQNVPGLMIKTSKKPGHTKSFQFFQVGNKLCLVDMPGYGFNQPKWFESAIQHYLMHRKNLIKTFLITDGHTGLQQLDEITINLLESNAIPYCTIMTKIDKASDSLRLRNLLRLQAVRKEYNSVYSFPHPFMLSSLTYEGLSYFLAFLGHITGNLSD